MTRRFISDLMRRKTILRRADEEKWERIGHLAISSSGNIVWRFNFIDFLSLVPLGMRRVLRKLLSGVCFPFQ